MTWKAIYEYEARTEDEISFPDGASLDIYERNDPEWWLARYKEEVGLIPATYVSEVCFVSVHLCPGVLYPFSFETCGK